MDKDGISEWHLLLQLILVNRLKLSISENCLSRQLICRHVKMLFLTGDFNSSILKIISMHVKFKTYKFSFILVNLLKLSISYIDSDLKINLYLHLKVVILACDF